MNVKEKWERILADVEKPEVPLLVLDRISIKLVDGTKININVVDLLSEGGDPEDIEANLQARLLDLDEVIDDVDFYVNIDSVARAVQPETDKLLNKL